MIHLAAFLAAFALDYADAHHKLAVEARAPWRAAGWSVAMYLLGLLSLWAALDAPITIASTCAGLAAGSVVALRRAGHLPRRDG